MKRLVLASLFALTCAIPSAHAATLQLDINVLLNGGTAVQGDQTVATLLFEDVAAGQVRLTVTSSLNNINEFISDIAFNVHSSFTPSAITASYIANSQVGAFTLPTLNSSTQDGQNPAGPSTGYDHNYAFFTGGGPNGSIRFNLNDSFQYLFSANGLDALDFSVANSAGYYAFAHVQGIGPNANLSSGYVALDPSTPAVPEPTSLILLATGLIAGARTLRKKKA